MSMTGAETVMMSLSVIVVSSSIFDDKFNSQYSLTDKKAIYIINTSQLGPQIYELAANSVEEKKRYLRSHNYFLLILGMIFLKLCCCLVGVLAISGPD